MRYVVRAVTLQWGQMLAAILLGIATIYIFAVLRFGAFNSSQGSYSFGPDFEDYFTCDTLWRCFESHVDLGFSASPVWENEISGFSAAFDFTYHIFILVILVSVVGSIIIDTVSTMRQEREETRALSRNLCFVCGRDRDTLNMHGQGDFKQHVTTSHNAWAYSYLRHYLRLKNKFEPTELTGQESYLHEQFERRSTSMFPIGRAMCLEQPSSLHH